MTQFRMLALDLRECKSYGKLFYTGATSLHNCYVCLQGMGLVYAGIRPRTLRGKTSGYRYWPEEVVT